MIKKLNKYIIVFLLSSLLISCAGDKKTLNIGSKPFTENMLLAEMIAQLSENQGIKVKRSIPFGSTKKIMEALKQGVIDIYPEYNGTGLIFLGQAPTSDGKASSEILKKLFTPLGLEMTGKFGFSNDYAMVMTAERSQELGVKTIGDLAKLKTPVKYVVNESFLERPVDGLHQMNRRYGIANSNVVSFPPDTAGKDKIIAALLNGSADVGEMFMTDGQIAEYGLVVLKDNLQFFPVYEVAPLARSKALKSIKGVKDVLAKLAGAISADDMQNMNKAVDLEARSVASVATEFLVKKGLVSKSGSQTSIETLLLAVDPSIKLSNKTAIAMRAVRAGFKKKDIAIFNSPDPLGALSDVAGVAMIGAESFYTIDKNNNVVLKDNAEAFAVLGYKTAHLISSKANNKSLSSMQKVLTGPEGSSSDIVLRMILNSYGIADKVQVINSNNDTKGLIKALASKADGLFLMRNQGDIAIANEFKTGAYKLVSLDEWAKGGHTGKFSFIRPSTIPSSIYPAQGKPVASITTQYVLASPVEIALSTGDVGPGNAFKKGSRPTPLSADSVNAIRDSLGTSELIDPAIPVHSALVPKIEVVDKSLPFNMDISLINILMIVFIIWVLYIGFRPMPAGRDFSLDD